MENYRIQNYQQHHQRFLCWYGTFFSLTFCLCNMQCKGNITGKKTVICDWDEDFIARNAKFVTASFSLKWNSFLMVISELLVVCSLKCIIFYTKLNFSLKIILFQSINCPIILCEYIPQEKILINSWNLIVVKLLLNWDSKHMD